MSKLKRSQPAIRKSEIVLAGALIFLMLFIPVLLLIIKAYQKRFASPFDFSGTEFSLWCACFGVSIFIALRYFLVGWLDKKSAHYEEMSLYNNIAPYLRHFEHNHADVSFMGRHFSVLFVLLPFIGIIWVALYLSLERGPKRWDIEQYRPFNITKGVVQYSQKRPWGIIIEYEYYVKDKQRHGFSFAVGDYRGYFNREYFGAKPYPKGTVVDVFFSSNDPYTCGLLSPDNKLIQQYKRQWNMCYVLAHIFCWLLALIGIIEVIRGRKNKVSPRSWLLTFRSQRPVDTTTGMESGA